MRCQSEFARQRVKEWLDSGDDQFPDELASVLKHAHDFMVSERRVAEGNLPHDPQVCLDFLVKEVSGHRRYYRAVINKTVFEFRDECSSVRMGENCPRFCGERRQSERVMLVHVRQFGELPQEVQRALVLIEPIRLEGGDNLESLRRDGVQFLQTDRLVNEVVLAEADRELCLSCRNCPVVNGQFVGDVVERTAKVMDDVPNDDGEIERWLFCEVERESWFAIARIAMTSQSIRAVVHVSPDFVVEHYEMFVGSPELRDHASEGM